MTDAFLTARDKDGDRVRLRLGDKGRASSLGYLNRRRWEYNFTVIMDDYVGLAVLPGIALGCLGQREINDPKYGFMVLA